MGFTIEEFRAGHALAQKDVAQAEAAVAAAQGRRERRTALAELERVRGVLDVSRTMLENAARQMGVHPYVVHEANPVPHPRSSSGSTEPRFADQMMMSDVLQCLENFGSARRSDGDVFLESEFAKGSFFYQCGPQRTGINVWGRQDDWALSVFSAARVGMRSNLELFQFVARWRTTKGIGAPYVVQDGDRAAIMCERTFQNSQFASDVTGWRMISSTIDLVGAAAQEISRWLVHSDDGIPFTAEGEVGHTLLLGWWEVNDERIRAFR